MTEVDTLIAVAGTLGGTLAGVFLGYLLDERRATNRLRRETALKPLPDKQSALRDAYYNLVDLELVIVGVANPNREEGRIREALVRFEQSVGKAAFWMMKSPDNLEQFMNAEQTVRDACYVLLSGGSLSQVDKDVYAGSLSKAAVAIGNELGIDVLESQRRELLSRFLTSPSGSNK